MSYLFITFVKTSPLKTFLRSETLYIYLNKVLEIYLVVQAYEPFFKI